jgi:hypothetical protein
MVLGETHMMFEVADLKLAGIDDRNISTIHEYEEYLTKILPSSEIIRDMFIDVDFEMLLSDLYFFTDGFMVEIPDFVTFHQGRYHQKKLNIIIHPIKKALVYINVKMSEAKESGPHTLSVCFRTKAGTSFSFSGSGENSVKLEYIAKTYLIPNLENG